MSKFFKNFLLLNSSNWTRIMKKLEWLFIRIFFLDNFWKYPIPFFKVLCQHILIDWLFIYFRFIDFLTIYRIFVATVAMPYPLTERGDIVKPIGLSALFCSLLMAQRLVLNVVCKNSFVEGDIRCIRQICMNMSKGSDVDAFCQKILT